MEKQTPTLGGGVGSTTATWGSVHDKSEEEIPESEVERWSGVRSRLDAILGVLTRGRWSSTREGGNMPRRPGVADIRTDLFFFNFNFLS